MQIAIILLYPYNTKHSKQENGRNKKMSKTRRCLSVKQNSSKLFNRLQVSGYMVSEILGLVHGSIGWKLKEESVVINLEYLEVNSYEVACIELFKYMLLTLKTPSEGPSTPSGVGGLTVQKLHTIARPAILH